VCDAHIQIEVERGRGWVSKSFAVKDQCWAALALDAEGAAVRAWVNNEPALVGVFKASRCEFCIVSEQAVNLPEGQVFACVVDGAVCSYKLLEDVRLDERGELRVEMESLQQGPWAHLDYAGDFSVHEAGLRVWNLAPSHDGLSVGSGYESQLIAEMNKSPFVVVIRRRKTP